MTTSNDTLASRENSDKYGPSKEQTVGVTRDGFVDPTGEYPKRDYFFGSSVNHAARGIKVNNLNVNGGDISLSLELPAQKASTFPFNDVRETPSGHVIEVDDTPGGERILIKHRLGSGIELRADGSTVMSTIRNKVEVTGGDNSVIVEGQGNLVYKGNMTLTVTGDYNVNVGGNYNVNVAGNENVDVRHSSRTTIGNNKAVVISGDNETRVVQNDNYIALGNYCHSVKGDAFNLVEGDIEIVSGADMFLTSKSRAIMSSPTTSITAANLSVMGASGTIGGEAIEHYGKQYSGPSGKTGDQTVFWGTLIGKASEAITSEFAQKADQAYTAHQATHAGAAAVSLVAKEISELVIYPGEFNLNDASTIVTNPDYKMNHAFTETSPTTHMPTETIVNAVLATSEHGIRNVRIDPNDDILNKAIKSDDYDGQIQFTPTTAEIRSLMREQVNRSNEALTSTLVAEGRLGSTWKSSNPSDIGATLGRVASSTPSARFGYTVIGNNPMENRSKRFKPE